MSKCQAVISRGSGDEYGYVCGSDAVNCTRCGEPTPWCAEHIEAHYEDDCEPVGTYTLPSGRYVNDALVYNDIPAAPLAD